MTDIFMKLAEYTATAPEEEFDRFTSYLEGCRDSGELPDEDFNTLLKSLNVARSAKEEISYGTYAVKVDRIFLSKVDNIPAVVFHMQTLAKDLIAINQPIVNGYQVHIVNEFMRDLCAGMDNPPEIKFKTFAQYGEIIDRVSEMLHDRYVYLIRFYDNNGFPAYAVEGVASCQ